MKYEKSPSSYLFQDNDVEIMEGRFEGVTITIAVSSDWVSVYEIHSSNPGHGEATRALEELKRDYPGKEIFSSIPLNDVARHIFEKAGIPF